LAGRLAVCELTPFLAVERPAASVDSLWLRGGFPDGGALRRGRFPEWQTHYLDLLAQRDLPQWGLAAKPQETLRFLKMIAASHGAIWNASEVGRSLGLSYHTVNGYLDFLEGAFLARRLAPFHGNLRKRLVKSPKVYWRDSGLLHSLLGASTFDELLAKPWVGASWEGFVIGQILDFLSAKGKRFDASYFRTSDGHEIDLVLELSGKRWAVEIKLTSSPGTADMDRLMKAAGHIHCDYHVLVSRTARISKSADAVSTHLHGIMVLLGKN
jgi:predicted AAA+ superfamily ATPase